jgi:hypothetical protein
MEETGSIGYWHTWVKITQELGGNSPSPNTNVQNVPLGEACDKNLLTESAHSLAESSCL